MKKHGKTAVQVALTGYLTDAVPNSALFHNDAHDMACLIGRNGVDELRNDSIGAVGILGQNLQIDVAVPVSGEEAPDEIGIGDDVFIHGLRDLVSPVSSHKAAAAVGQAIAGIDRIAGRVADLNDFPMSDTCLLRIAGADRLMGKSSILYPF